MSKILGNYATKLNDFYFQQLTQLALQAAAQGEYSGGRLLDATVIAQLKAQASDFNAVPFVSAGERATEESIQNAVNVLQGKYAALANERNDFLVQMNKYLAVLRQDNELIEALIHRIELQNWVSRQPAISDASQFSWDFAISAGTVPDDWQTDQIGLIRAKRADESNIRRGVGEYLPTTEVTPGSLTWNYSTNGQPEELLGPNWAKLSVLESAPRTHFGSPEVKLVLPTEGVSTDDWSEFFTLTGENSDTNLPYYIRNTFLPRRTVKWVQFTQDVDQTVTLSPYRIVPDDVLVFADDKMYFASYDYTLTSSCQIQPLKNLRGKVVTVAFTEYFPAYQCSVDRKVWSDPIMFDPARPAPDTILSSGVSIINDQFPVTDEVGNPSGMCLIVKNVITREFTICVQNARPATDTQDFGFTATLDVEFDRPLFLNGVRLEPFASFPCWLRSVYAESILGSNPAYVWRGNYLIDSTQDILFDRREVLRLRLEFFQPTFTIKEHLVNTEAQKKQNAMLALQATLPFQVRNTNYPPVTEYHGFQYEFGVRSITGLATDPTASVLAGTGATIFNGPFEVTGCPDIVRLDSETLGTVSLSVNSVEYGSDGTSQAAVETPVAGGGVFVYQKITAAPASVQFFIKAQFANSDALFKRYLLQVRNVQ